MNTWWNQLYLTFSEEPPKDDTIKTVINQDVLAKARNDSECGSLIVECGSPAKNALQLLAEIDNNQEQSLPKSALKLLDEVDQIEPNLKVQEVSMIDFLIFLTTQLLSIRLH